MDENDMARDFGFDISMPDGNVGLPSAAHKLYMDQCQALYREFMANMAMHIKTEKELKRALRMLHEEKIRNLRFSLYRSESADPFARKVEPTESSTPAFLDSRVNTPWGLDIIPDEDGSGCIRPQTAPAGAPGNRKGTVQQDQRPKTAGVSNSPNLDEEDNGSESGLSEISAVTKSTVVGVVDRKTELGSGRKITVGQQSFVKITHGNVRAKLKHKDGRFIVKPVKVNGNMEGANSDTMAYDPALAKQQFDPASERLALVRKLTTFKTPTISSDMKINNRVPIQKRLKGIEAKRTTISEIYQDARDRRARHFRIVTNQPNKGAFGKDTSERTFRPDLSQRWARALRQSISIGRDQSGRSSLLFSGTTATGNSRSMGESFTAKDFAANAFVSVFNDISKRPTSKVAFARADSQLSHDSVFYNDDHEDLSASMNGGYNHNQFASTSTANTCIRGPANTSTPTHSPGQFGRKLFFQPSQAAGTGRVRTESGNSVDSDARARSANLTPAEKRGHVAADGRARAQDRQMSADTATRNEKNLLTIHERPASVSSTGTAKTNLSKLKLNLNPEQNSGGKNGNGIDKKMVRSPTARDTAVTIVKQQKRMDKVLDERMAVWRRRMAVKSSAMSTKMRPSPRKGKVM